VENHSKRLVYRLHDCLMHQRLTETCGPEIADTLPCRFACLAACRTIHQELEIDARITMDAMLPHEGYCQFSVNRG